MSFNIISSSIYYIFENLPVFNQYPPINLPHQFFLNNFSKTLPKFFIFYFPNLTEYFASLILSHLIPSIIYSYLNNLIFLPNIATLVGLLSNPISILAPPCDTLQVNSNTFLLYEFYANFLHSLTYLISM